MTDSGNDSRSRAAPTPPPGTATPRLPVALQDALAGRYRLEREIGRGGMATVWLARDLKHQRAVAIKVLREDVGKLLGVERFAREIEIVAQLTHPHILPLFDSGEAGQLLYYVMPFIEGESLRQRLLREKQLPIDDAVQIASDVAGALSHAHSRGIVHRDIKPENILLEGGRAIVADFGIARALSTVDQEELTATGVVPGTPVYMSPEQAGAAEVDGRSDIYSLGCVLYEMLAGDPPFRGSTMQATLAKHALESPPSLEIVRPTVSSVVLAAVRKSLAKVPADRFATASAFAAALTAATPVQVPHEQRPTSARLMLGLVTAAAIALIATVVAIGVLLVRPASPPLDGRRVVVFPLSTTDTLPDAGLAGWSIALAIEAALEHTQPLRWVDGWTWLPESLRVDPRRVTPAVARSVSRERGARYYIDGVLRRDAGESAVVLRLHDVRGDSVLAQETARGRVGADIASLAFDAIRRILPTLLEPGRVVDLAPLTARSLGAIALSIQGDQEYRRSRFTPALEFYQRAVQEDSLLAFAAVKGAQAASWVNRAGDAAALLRLALRHDSLLPEKYRLFARGLDAYFAGAADSGLRRFGAALAVDSGWAEAWMGLGEVYYHLLPDGGPLDSLARHAFETAARVDSSFSPALVHLAEIAIRRGDVQEAIASVEHLEFVRSDTTLARELSLILACVGSGGRAFDWDPAAATNPAAVMLAAKDMAAGAALPRCAKGAFRSILARPDLPGPYKWAALLGLQGLLLVEERFGEVRTLLDSSVASGMRAAYSLYVFDAIAGAPFAQAADEAERVAREGAGPYYERAGPDTRWLLGVWHARQGRVGRADTLATLLHRHADSAGNAHARVLGDALVAHVRLARGDTAGAIRQLTSLRSVAPPSDLSWGLAAPLPIERFTLAALLVATGQSEDGYRRAEVFDHPAPIMFLPYLRQSLSVRLRAAGALGAGTRSHLERRLNALTQHSPTAP